MLYRTPPEERQYPDRKPLPTLLGLMLTLWRNDRELVILTMVITVTVLVSILSEELS
jgi:hypothetical protein